MPGDFGGIGEMGSVVAKDFLVHLKKAVDTETKSFSDMALYYMMLDAADADEPIEFKVKPVFKPDTKHPMIDKLDADKELVVSLLYNQ